MTAVQEAGELILQQLRCGPARATEVFEAAKREGISHTALKRAKRALGIRARKSMGTMHGAWIWELPPQNVTTAHTLLEAVRNL
jgi:hypothetical protein